MISKKTRKEFREYFVGLYLREIEAEFDAADVPFVGNYVPKNISGQRRSLVEQYYHAVDWTKWSDVRKILIVYENVLTHLEDLSETNGLYENNEWAQNTFKSLKKWIERDGFIYSNGKLNPVGKNASLSEITSATSHFDAPELHRQIERIKNAVEDDPGLAIGTSKELIETTCKTILSERGVQYDNNSGNVTQGLGELRNLYGTGHGKHSKEKGLSPRHARLAVGTAATLAMFLFETHEERAL